jgi:hypothetical protein
MRPRNIHSNKEYERILQQYLTFFTKINKQHSQIIKNFKLEEDPIIKKLEKLFEIPKLNQVQTISMHAMKSLFQD